MTTIIEIHIKAIQPRLLLNRWPDNHTSTPSVKCQPLPRRPSPTPPRARMWMKLNDSIPWMTRLSRGTRPVENTHTHTHHNKTTPEFHVCTSVAIPLTTPGGCRSFKYHLHQPLRLKKPTKSHHRLNTWRQTDESIQSKPFPQYREKKTIKASWMRKIQCKHLVVIELKPPHTAWLKKTTRELFHTPFLFVSAP